MATARNRPEPPVNRRLGFEAAPYPNKGSAKILRDGFSEGFRLGYMGKMKSGESHNLKSVTHLQDKVIEKLNKKIELGKIAGPFSSNLCLT